MADFKILLYPKLPDLMPGEESKAQALWWELICETGRDPLKETMFLRRHHEIFNTTFFQQTAPWLYIIPEPFKECFLDPDNLLKMCDMYSPKK